MTCECTVSGYGDLHQAGLWMKVNVKRQGDYLVATLYSSTDGNPSIATFKVNMREMMDHFMLKDFGIASHDVVGWNPIKEAKDWGNKKYNQGKKKLQSAYKKTKAKVVKIARTKLAKKVYRGVKKTAKFSKAVVRSKLTGVALTALAAFPPTAAVGVPALAAYVVANQYLDRMDEGIAQAREIKSKISEYDSVDKLRGKLKGMGGVEARKYLSTRPQARMALARAGRAKKQLRSVMHGSGYARAMSIAAKYRKTRKKVRTIFRNTKSRNPVLRHKAQQAAAVLRVVRKNRRNLSAIAQTGSKGLPGLLINYDGTMTRGKFHRQGVMGSKALLYTSKAAMRGKFALAS